jgi:NDP-sugar pyrophosphorylase family protein
VSLREKPTERLLISAGIYVLDPCVIRMVPPNREFHMPELFDLCLRDNLRVAARLIEDEWADVGRHEELRRAKGEI